MDLGTKSGRHSIVAMKSESHTLMWVIKYIIHKWY
jgi:hypothetical protein